MYARRLSERQATTHTEYSSIARPSAVCIRHVSSGMYDVLEVGLQRPTPMQLRRVADLKKRLKVAGVKEVLTPIEAMHVIGYAGIGEAGSKNVIAAVRATRGGLVQAYREMGLGPSRSASEIPDQLGRRQIFWR